MADGIIKLVLFHPAGTGATIYHGWMDFLDKAFHASPLVNEYTLEVYPMELPGRGMRTKEALLTTMQDAVQGATDAIMDVVLPCTVQGQKSTKKTHLVVMGHSLGGWIAFEVVREIQRRCGSDDGSLLCLIVSAIRSPTLAGVEHDIDTTAMHTLNYDEFWEVMERRYGKNPDLEHPSIRKFIYPVLKADFTISETYTGGDLVQSLPLFVSGGTSDVRYTEDMLAAWSACSTSDIFQLEMFPGGHSYLFPNRDEKECQHCLFVLECIQASLAQQQQPNNAKQQQQQEEEEEDVTKSIPAPISDEETSIVCHPPETATMSLSSVSRAESSTMTPPLEEDEKMQKPTWNCSSALVNSCTIS